MTFFRKCVVGDQDKTAILRPKSCRERKSARKIGCWTEQISTANYIYACLFLLAWSFVFAVIDARKANLLFCVF